MTRNDVADVRFIEAYTLQVTFEKTSTKDPPAHSEASLDVSPLLVPLSAFRELICPSGW